MSAHRCGHCRQKATHKCVECHVPYCGTLCQEKDWHNVHKQVCAVISQINASVKRRKVDNNPPPENVAPGFAKIALLPDVIRAYAYGFDLETILNLRQMGPVFGRLHYNNLFWFFVLMRFRTDVLPATYIPETEKYEIRYDQNVNYRGWAESINLFKKLLFTVNTDIEYNLSPLMDGEYYVYDIQEHGSLEGFLQYYDDIDFIGLEPLFRSDSSDDGSNEHVDEYHIRVLYRHPIHGLDEEIDNNSAWDFPNASRLRELINQSEEKDFDLEFQVLGTVNQ